MPAAVKLLTHIQAQIDTMRELARRPDEVLVRSNAAISAWSPAEHLDHLTKVGTSVLKRIASDDIEPLTGAIRPIGRLILFLGWIPRGKGRAPERLRGAMCKGADILQALEEQERILTRVRSMTFPKIPIVPHPRFGALTAPQALRFVSVHNDHHMKIIADIERP